MEWKTLNCIVIPTYKERKTIKSNLPSILKFVGKKDKVLLIDDTKNFETKQFQDEQVLCFPRLRGKRGYGESLKTGLMIATFILKSDRVVQMDIDHDPEYIPKLLRHNSDVIIGFDKSQSAKRRLVSSGSRILCRLLGLRFFQPTCGFRMFKSQVLRKLEWRKIRSKGFHVQVEVLYRMKQNKAKIDQMVISHLKRKHDKSKMNLRQTLSWNCSFVLLLGKHLYYSLASLIMGK